MFIGHLPAGYILSPLFTDSRAKAALLIGAVLPDIDLFYFYTIGERAAVHHSYATHTPVFWVALIGLWAVIMRFVFKQPMGIPALALLCGTLLHLLLDSITGGVFWLAPFSDAELIFFHVPARYPHWIMNFVFHWTFALELVTCAAASLLFLRRRKKYKAQNGAWKTIIKVNKPANTSKNNCPCMRQGIPSKIK